MLFLAHVVYSVIAQVKHWEYCHKITITKKIELDLLKIFIYPRISDNLEGKSKSKLLVHAWLRIC